ncbi:hypothetical protein TIFTF001_008029 [Ficus carica]|uniref:Uncharacterized protein n=1 Tax=Ficus carica TaxID=3494 RepID=A0AA88AEC6_FICCA|nr:hypothetical protein TIFTF001_008029 [Ficus carica]
MNDRANEGVGGFGIGGGVDPNSRGFGVRGGSGSSAVIGGGLGGALEHRVGIKAAGGDRSLGRDFDVGPAKIATVEDLSLAPSTLPKSWPPCRSEAQLQYLSEAA